MKNFDADIVTELARLEARAFWLIECQFDTTYYFTDCDVDLVYDGDTYQSDQGLRVANVRQGVNFAVEKVTLEFGNVGLWMSSILLNEDAVNDTVIVRYVMFDATVPIMAGGEAAAGVVIEDGDVTFEDGDVVFQSGAEYYSLVGTPPVLFNGYVSDWHLSESTARINLTNEFMLWRKKTLRIPAPSCPWAFKATECGYSGSETWCDQSADRCKALSNYDSFGGRRYISAIESKKLWWGVK